MGQGFRLSNSGVLWDAGFRGLGISLLLLFCIEALVEPLTGTLQLERNP